MRDVDFGYVGNIGDTIYRNCFEKYIKTQDTLKLGWDILGGHLSRLRFLRIRSGGPNLRYFPRANEEPSSFCPLFPIQRMA